MRLMSRAALSLAATLLAAPALHAQASFSIAAGAAVPVGSTAKVSKVGYNATLGLGIKPPLAPIGLRIEGALNQMDAKVSAGGSSRIMAGIANVTLSGAGMPIPMGYLIGGVGMYNFSVTGTPVKPASQTKVGFNIGAGLNFPLTGFSTFLEARLHYISTSGTSVKFIPITFGLKF